MPTEFRIPRNWHDGVYNRSHAKQAKEAKLPREYHDILAAELLVKTCVDPAIRKQVDSYYWSPEKLAWQPRTLPL